MDSDDTGTDIAENKAQEIEDLANNGIFDKEKMLDAPQCIRTLVLALAEIREDFQDYVADERLAQGSDEATYK
ncbi:hypothetical protein HA402_010422 [Bradysia odoriphaga]|nr:hypothetical protein HA402_010422 [Bradysia odoriphaga]